MNAPGPSLYLAQSKANAWSKPSGGLRLVLFLNLDMCSSLARSAQFWSSYSGYLREVRA